MILFTFLALLLAIAYAFIIQRYVYYWQQLPYWKNPSDSVAETKVSVLIPARNEAANITASLQSLKAQSYPARLFEVIIIDDFSEDNTAELVEQFPASNIRLLSLEDFLTGKKTQSYKKKAIEAGIQAATGELIITSDADCYFPTDWIALMVGFYQATDAKFIAAPVGFYDEKNSLEYFQSLDFMGMMLITGAGIQGRFMHMCNGANLAYPKAVFEAVGGFTGIDHKASGDDIFLLQKVVAHYPGSVYFLKNPSATVLTRAKPDLNSFIQQRLRWATKNASYREWKITAILAIVFFFCWAILISPFLSLVWGWKMLFVFFFLLSSKVLADWFFLSTAAHFFSRQDALRHFLSAQFMHIAYIAGIGLLANLKKEYEWKGRRVR